MKAEQITLNNGVKIPQLGLGVFQMTNTVDAVKWALLAGYRHVDGAAIYGNEEGLGHGVRLSGIPREEIFITTKLWNEDIRQGRVEEAFQASLDKLQTDYIDLYLIHWPAQGYEQAWLEMEKLYKAGKVKAIGVSNFHMHHIESLKKAGATVLPAVNQIESHPYLNNQMLIDACSEQGIKAEVWSPLGGSEALVLEDATLKQLAEKYGKSPAQIILRWDIQRGVIVIPKSAKQHRINQNIEIFDFELSDEDMSAINALNRDARVGPDPDNFDF